MFLGVGLFFGYLSGLPVIFQIARESLQTYDKLVRHRGPSALSSRPPPYLSAPPATTPPEFATAGNIGCLILHPLPPSMAQQPHQVCGSCIARHAPHPWLNLSPGSTSGQGRSRRGPARRNGCRRSGCPLRLLPCHRGGEDLWYPTLG